MARQYTPTYRMGYFSRGGTYSGETDFRRFTTMDYNMEDYVGIVGVGVITGWEVQATSTPLTVQILPGTGMIDGFYSESEYEFKQRSAMVSGEREVEIVEDDDIPEADLTSAERAIYIAVRQEYEPSYYNPDPGGPIKNYFIKVVNMNVSGGNTITLADNSDTYIFAERKYPDPYDDCWNSGSFTYAPLVGDRPSSSNYSRYSEFKAALDTYTVALDAMHNYKWREYLQNHFTSVQFTVDSVFIKSPSKVLLAKVVTRNGSITKIDTSQVDSIANLYAAIKEQARPYVAGHTHGGDDPFDPPAINLKTDIRNCALYSYQTEGQVATFDILENTLTSVDAGHQHSYKIDGDGNGNTVEVLGSTDNHFHKISEFAVENQEYSPNPIETHNHTIEQERDPLDLESSYVVYVNDVPATYDAEVDLVKRQATVYGLIGEVYKTYFSSFDVQVRNSVTSEIETKLYSFEKSAPNVLKFMLEMMLDFDNTFPIDQTVDEADLAGSLGGGVANQQSLISGGGSIAGEGTAFDTSRHPFLFTTEDGGLAGFDEVVAQSTIAQTLLKEVGEEYTFTPNAAKNITILLQDAPSQSITDYNVQVEFLGNTEVTGVLRDESIAFISAEKFTLGVFDIARIPPLNHMGRMGEEFLPFQYPLVSTNGIRYSVSPALTTVAVDHYHKLRLNENLDGTTNNTYVGEDPVYYAYYDGKSYLIAHNHGVTTGEVLEGDGRDLDTWQTAMYGTNVSSAHTHSVIESVKGDPKIIYALAETPEGSVLAGTSTGVYIIPSDNAYLFVINGVKIYQIGNNLWTLLLQAKAEYEKQTGLELIVTESLYLKDITDAAEEFVADGDTVLMKGYINPIRGQDEIMLQKTESFLLPNFKYVGNKPLNQVTDEEVVLDVQLVFSDGTTATQADINYYISDDGPGLDELEGSTVELATVEKDLHGVPMWSIITDSSGSVFVCGSTEYSKNTNIETNLYKDWSLATKPNYSSVLRKAFKDSLENVWIPTEGGLMVARNYQNGNVIEVVNNAGIAVSVNDIVEGTSGKIYTANNTGISLSEDEGKTWTTSLEVSGGCSKVLKDVSTGKLFAITNKFVIYSSTNGVTWESIGSMLQQEYGDIIAWNGYLYVCVSDGLYRIMASGSGTWTRVLNIEAYSLCSLIDNSGIMVGGDQVIYLSLDGISYTKIIEIDGAAAPSLYTNNERQLYGYAYGNKNQQFFFKGITYTEDSVSALVDFNIWMAKEGGWDDEDPIDIYINSKLIYSSKRNIDNRISSNYLFNIDSSQGMLNFGASTTLASATEVFDNSISVADSTGFAAGDRIYVVNTESLPTEPSKPDSYDNITSYFSSLVTYYQEKESLENMFFYAEVSGVAAGVIFLDRNIDTIVNTPANVYKIPNLSGTTPIFSNIYDSMLSNIGTNNHEAIDDKITYTSDFRPYQLNNSYLSNLLQLTQAVKYVYPEIDEYMINTNLFDFRYSWSVSDPTYPYIGDIIDLSSSEIYNQGLYDSDFASVKSRIVNKILIGHGTFANTIIVATDIGIFYAKLDTSLEYNWFYTYNLRIPVYDLLISNRNRLLAATGNGLFDSTDIVNWNAPTQPAIAFPVYTLSYRWTGRETVTVNAASATFENVDGQGKITSATPLGEIDTNRIIRIEGASEKDGNYSTLTVSNTEIVVSEEFPGSTAIYSNVVIEMGSWWEYLDSDTSTDNPQINNTLMAGGRSAIAFATNVSSSLSSNAIIWRQSEIPTTLPKFSTKDITPLSNGVVLSSIISTSDGEENNLLRCTGTGSQWNRFQDFKSVKGTIISKQATFSGHTLLKVTYTYPENYIGKDYSLNLKEIGFFSGSTLLLKTYVLGDETRKGFNYISVFGQEVMDVLNENNGVTFTVYPVKTNVIEELSNKNLLYATNNGIYYDEGSVVNFVDKNGEINKVGNGGTVTKIDITGTIKSISSNPSTSNVILGITTSDTISANQLVDSKIYITDLSIPEEYTIVSNSSLSPTGEISVEIEAEFSSLWNAYSVKKVTIVGDNSTVYITFDSPIATDQFKGGTLYVESDENNNRGKSYGISSNTNTYVILNEAIVPRSTFNLNNDSLIAGQSIKMVDSTNRIKLYTTFYDDTTLNQYVDYSFRVETISANTSALGSMTVYSNTSHEIILDPIARSEGQLPPILNFEPSSIFALQGNSFVPLEYFNNKLLYESDDHYHTVSLISQRLKGEIVTMTADGTAFMDITITGDSGFNSPSLLTDGTIINNCKVILYNPSNTAYSYETTSVSYVAGVLKLRISNSSIWNADSYEETKISPTWRFEIESRYSGLSSATYYRDFVTKIEYLTADIIEGESSIFVSSTSGINVGSKIRLFDTNGKAYESYVSNLVGPTQLEISPTSDNSFLITNNAGIKVLEDNFSNNHTHRIVNSQVDTLLISDYLGLGYDSTHSHKLAPFIKDVTDLVASGSFILAVGSSEFVYVSYNSGVSWKVLVNLNNSLEWNEEVTGISQAALNGSQIVVGTTNGQIFSNTYKGWTNIPLEKPL